MKNSDIFEVEERLRKLLAEEKKEALVELLAGMPPREMVHVFAHVPKLERLELLTMLPPEFAATIVAEIPDYQASRLISDMDVVAAAAIVHEMHSDEQADLIMDLDKEDAEAILSELDAAEAADVRKLLTYDADTAGGLMITEYIHLPVYFSISEAIDYLRKHVDEFSDYEIKYIYVTGDDDRFLGVLQMQDLLLGKSDRSLAGLLKPAEVVSSRTALRELQDFFEASHFFGVPVLDDDGKMVGVVLQRVVLEMASEKQAQALLEAQGIVGGEELRSMPVLLRSRRRLSWLSVNIFLNMIAASVIAFYQDTLSSVIALAVFLPIISDMSGCSGNQAVAVSMRELSIGTVRPGEVLRVWLQELSVGAINGIVLGILIGLAAWLWQGNPYLGFVAGAALALNTLVAVSIGGTVPLLLKKFGVDPALASGPILTTITDMFGFFLVLTLATMLLDYLV